MTLEDRQADQATEHAAEPSEPVSETASETAPTEDPQGAAVRSLYGLDGRRWRRRRRPPVEEALVVDLSDEEEPDAPRNALDLEPLPAPPPVPPERFEPPGPTWSLPATSSLPRPQPRASRFRAFRAWWREESLARAAERRARATAEAILRAQALQAATRPIDHAPEPREQHAAMQGVLTLTEERFQSLGIRSDRISDELTGITRSLGELRHLVVTSPKRVSQPATQLLADLEGRFDSLLLAMSEELARQSMETERKISELITLQSAELATMLESAVNRIRTAIPVEMERTRAATMQELERIREAIPAGFELVTTAIPHEIEKIRVEIPIRSTGSAPRSPRRWNACGRCCPSRSTGSAWPITRRWKR